MPPSQRSATGAFTALRSLEHWIGVIGERRGRLFIGAMLMLATFVSALGLLSLSGWFITATAMTALTAAGYLDVFTPGSGIRFFAVSRTVSRYLERLYNHDTVLRLLADLRARVFAGLLKLDAATLSRSRASQWLNRLTADIDTLDSLYLRLLAPPLVALVGIAGFALFAGHFLPVAGWTLAVVLVPLWLGGTLGCAIWGWRPSHRRMDRQERLRGRAIEQVEGLPELLAYRAVERHRRLWQEEEAALTQDQRTLGRRLAVSNAVVTLTIQLTVLAVLLLAAVAFRDGVVTGPVMVMLALGTLAMGEGLGSLPMAFGQLGATVRAAERLNQQAPVATERDAAPDVDGDSAGPSGAAPALRYQKVDVTRDARVVLAGLTLAIAPGKRVGIIGPSGIGKSTLAELAVGLLPPSHGDVMLDDHAINDSDSATSEAASSRARIGYLTQRSELFHDTLAANLRLGDPDADDAALLAALDRVSLTAWANSLPEGLETWVGEQGRQLSGGQARRVALARVMLRDSPLVILDEPLSGLDAETANAIKRELETWLGSRTLLALGHAFEALPRCDRYLRLDVSAAGQTRLTPVE
ncbi:thiol reductant ABC exporter subunit CydC [Salinicola halophilus]|uniref:thiol reductant ABC exporter subunit CydC n=1 Tax=Salinicola halophilus TaxID=184065 RepID=UPI001EF8744D|nr:thiol reductant ABC exporter subunit CydC [Salinicola halophilus]